MPFEALDEFAEGVCRLSSFVVEVSELAEGQREGWHALGPRDRLVDMRGCSRLVDLVDGAHQVPLEHVLQ